MMGTSTRSAIAKKLKHDFAETLDKEWRIRNCAKDEPYDAWVASAPPVTDYPQLREALFNGYCKMIDLCELYREGKLGTGSAAKDELGKRVSAAMSKLYHTLEKETADIDPKYGVNPFKLWRPIYWDATQDYQYNVGIAVSHLENEIHIT